MVRIKNNYPKKLTGIFDTNKNTKELIIICHGSRGSKNSNIQKFLSKKLNKKFNIFRFDFSGNGDSEGKLEDSTYSKDIEDLLKIVNYFHKKKYVIRSIIGYSKSASEILLASKQLFRKVERIIAIAPRIDLFNTSEMRELKRQKEFFNKNKYYLFPDPKIKHKITLKYIDDIKKWENVIKHYTDKIPTLIIHGTKDRVVDISESKLFIKRFQKVEFVKIEKASHSFENELEELNKIISNYLEPRS
ncbi:alpha/beta fold hydrolase [Candidatus Pacearchaeota archaeon]|nr:alpha/beta fold hydrolase [Candidatus Pacearchaeota archaeon]